MLDDHAVFEDLGSLSRPAKFPAHAAVRISLNLGAAAGLAQQAVKRGPGDFPLAASRFPGAKVVGVTQNTPAADASEAVPDAPPEDED